MLSTEFHSFYHKWEMLILYMRIHTLARFSLDNTFTYLFLLLHCDGAIVEMVVKVHQYSKQLQL